MIHIIDLHFLDNKQAIAAFLIPSSDGLILIESGPYSTFSSLQKNVESLGYKITDIKHVLLTHIHLDHAGAAWKLAEYGAKVYVHPFGMKHLADPSKLMASAKRIYKDDMDRLWSDMKAIPESLLQAVNHKEQLIIGDKTITSWHTPGHASHHIAWQFEDVLFTGDVAGVKINNGPVVAPCPPPDISLEKWTDSIDLIRNLNPKKLFLTHYGEINNISEHLDELTDDLQKIAHWIKDKKDRGMTPQEATPIFDDWVMENLSKKGVDKEGLLRYKAANPAWMSVAGLYRYWTKKEENKL